MFGTVNGAHALSVIDWGIVFAFTASVLVVSLNWSRIQALRSATRESKYSDRRGEQ